MFLACLVAEIRPPVKDIRIGARGRALEARLARASFREALGAEHAPACADLKSDAGFRSLPNPRKRSHMKGERHGFRR